ncbi:hypothetical protein [Clostridium transplantifaecale]|uniref:hypothetical protein n=1 Tax=Clostridium transplantifaecale TaxID=2479838 RepID=UPI000F643766|nr:hypothetical protein [Clostridium transplantifaecale]
MKKKSWLIMAAVAAVTVLLCLNTFHSPSVTGIVSKGVKFLLAFKAMEANDPYSAVYTLRSGITGSTFTVNADNYETGSGSFDRLHLSDDYGDILGSRLRAGEEIALPFEEGFSVKFSDSGYIWFYVWRSEGGFELKFGSEYAECGESAEGKKYHIKLENDEMIFEIPVKGDRYSSYRFGINQKSD